MIIMIMTIPILIINTDHNNHNDNNNKKRRRIGRSNDEGVFMCGLPGYTIISTTCVSEVH